jgi:energy-coupling factor transport system permease protein
MRNTAADYFHPLTAFLYFFALFIMSMIFIHPFFIIVGVICVITLNLIYNGRGQIKSQLIMGIPLLIFISVFNPLINDHGSTVLFLFVGRPFTLEALIYGICSGGMLFEVILLFGAYNRVITTDKFLFLFSRFAPAASMLITMTQRMISLFTRRLSKIKTAQKTLLCDMSQGNLRQRTDNGLKITTVLMSWSLEDGLDTADSMKARGYGSGRRTFYSAYKFRGRDRLAITIITLLTLAVIIFYYFFTDFYFFPILSFSFSLYRLVLPLFLYLILWLLPIALELRHKIIYKRF